jgi:hypothetical protein
MHDTTLQTLFIFKKIYIQTFGIMYVQKKKKKKTDMKEAWRVYCESGWVGSVLLFSKFDHSWFSRSDVPQTNGLITVD